VSVLTDLVIRDAEALDLRSLSVALAYAADWNGVAPLSPGEAMLRPDLQKYLGDWPWPTDLGVIASIDGRDVGAAWARRLTHDDPGFGWVSDDIPELTIGVDPAMRGRGIGRALLDALTLRVGATAPGLSLSVEDGNAAARALYEDAGFAVVGRVGDSDTMLLRF
jgi:ribosomal protein S18 acetylase RimI-like enzyme